MTYCSPWTWSSSSRRSPRGCWWISLRLKRRLYSAIALVHWACTPWPLWSDDSHHPSAPGQPGFACPLSSTGSYHQGGCGLTWKTHLSAKSTRFDLFLNCFLKCPLLIFMSHCKTSMDQKLKDQTSNEIAYATFRRFPIGILESSYFQAGHRHEGFSLRFTVELYICCCSRGFEDRCMIAFENKWK